MEEEAFVRPSVRLLLLLRLPGLLLQLFLLFLHLLDLGRVLLVLLALRVQVVEIEDLDHLIFLEHELLNLAVVNGGRSADFLAVLEHDHGGQLPGEGRGVDVVSLRDLGVAADVDLACKGGRIEMELVHPSVQDF